MSSLSSPAVRVTRSPIQSPTAACLDVCESSPKVAARQLLGELRAEYPEHLARSFFAGHLPAVVRAALLDGVADDTTRSAYVALVSLADWREVADTLADGWTPEACDSRHDAARTAELDAAADQVLARAAAGADDLVSRDDVGERSPDFHTVGRCMAMGLI